MRQRSLLLSSLALALCLLRPALASDASSFFAYLTEVAEPGSVMGSNGREDRQLCNGPLCITLAFNGITNFTFPIATIPTTFPISCGGDGRNYCNYPDLPLLETYDLNYYSRRPIPSGRCPDGYTKMPTFDCLNIAPALFETTCCVFMSSVPNVCSSNLVIDSLFTLCNGSVYVTSGAYAWQLDQNFNLIFGPIMLAALTGGAISRDLAEAEVDGNCNVQFFTMDDRYYITNFADGSLSTSGPFLVTNLCLPGTPGLVYGTGSRGNNVYKIDGAGFVMVQNDGTNYLCGANTTCSIAVQPPGCLGIAPRINGTAATYLPSLDLIATIVNTGSGNTLYTSTRNGKTCSSGVPFSLCPAAATVAPTNVAPLVYIPYPVYPIFQQQQQQQSSNNNYNYAPAPAPSPAASSYSSSPAASPAASPSVQSYSAPAPSPSSYAG
jgi:hypothetical protein